MIHFGKVSKGDPMDLHEQVAAQIRRAIADGEAAPGERLAPAVDIAAILGVNKNTVIRALHALRDEGLLDFTRGRGIRVVGTPQRSALLLKVDELINVARRQGIRADELATLVASRAPGAVSRPGSNLLPRRVVP
jgi:GntR family transcriptional regulator